MRPPSIWNVDEMNERRFTRLFLPILEAGDSQQEDWQEVARRQWALTMTDIPMLLATCLQDTNTWVVIGAVPLWIHCELPVYGPHRKIVPRRVVQESGLILWG